jgi:hypothetical protein
MRPLQLHKLSANAMLCLKHVFCLIFSMLSARAARAFVSPSRVEMVTAKPSELAMLLRLLTPRALHVAACSSHTDCGFHLRRMRMFHRCSVHMPRTRARNRTVYAQNHCQHS